MNEQTEREAAIRARYEEYQRARQVGSTGKPIKGHIIHAASIAIQTYLSPNGAAMDVPYLLAQLDEARQRLDRQSSELEACWRALATALGVNGASQAVTQAEKELAELRAESEESEQTD
jgi:hypothetical protein